MARHRSAGDGEVAGAPLAGLFTVAEAAAALGYSPSQLRRRLAAGEIHGVRAGARLWLVPTAEVDRLRRRGRLRAPKRPRASSVVAKQEVPGYDDA